MPLKPKRRTGTPLGRPFWLLWSSTTASSLGDGIRYVAFPLLAAGLSRDPRAVALVSVAGFLPWPLFGLLGGAVVDRTDRRALMWRVDTVRTVLVGGFAVAVAAASPPIAALALVAFLLGVAETFFDNAASAIVPMLVDESVIERANSWILSTQTLMSTLIGAPVGGLLYALARVAPIAADAASFALSALLIAVIRGRFHPRGDASAATSVRHDIADGVRWLFNHRLLRILALLLAVMNGTSAAAEAVLVLYSLEVLHLHTAAFGLLLTLVAIGGVAGTAVAGPVRRLLGLRAYLGLIGLVQAAVLVAIGLTSSTAVAVVALLLVGVTSMMWNVTTVSLRQRLVPTELLGRVTSAYRVIGLGAMPVGAALAGLAAKGYGLHMPYLISAIVLGVATVGCLPVIADPRPAAHDTAG